jgi:hypothetical protein
LGGEWVFIPLSNKRLKRELHDVFFFI